MTDLLPHHSVIDGHRIAWGRHGSGPPVVLLHGTPAHSFIWRRVAPALTEAGFTVHLFDLLGYGASERPLEADTSVAAQETLLKKLLDQWDLAAPHIVGHDIGGAIALRLAVHSPERLASLTLVDSVSYDSWPSPSWQRIIARHVEGDEPLSAEAFRDLMTRQLQMAVADESRMSGDVLEAFLQPLTGLVAQPAFFAHQVVHYDSRYTQEITPFLSQLAMPVRLIWGEQDRWQPVHWGQRLTADIGAELTIIPEAGHFVMEDAPDAVAAALVAFLNSQR